MGNGYLKDHRHRFDNPHSHKSLFLPMLCSRPSVKSVALPMTDPLSDEAEPTSPKVGCMGQVKKRNGRVVGFPAPYKLASHCNKMAVGAGAIKANGFSNIVISCSNGGGKYSKLRKLFSSKTLLGNAANSPPSTVATTTALAAATSRRRSVCKSGSFGCQAPTSLKKAVNIGEMDPPLPVVKKVRKPAEEEEEGGSLWRRRFGGVAPDLRTLEIRHNNPKHQLQLLTV